MDFLGKKYKLVKSENFDDFLKEMGLSFIFRKAASAVHPIVMVEKNDDGSFTLTSITTLKTTKFVFREGEEQEEERGDGVMVKSTFLFENNTLTQTQKDPSGRVCKIVREFGPTQMKTVSSIDGSDIKCERWYDLVQ